MDAYFHIAVPLCSHNTDYMDSLHEPVNTLARIWWWPPEDGSLCDPKHVGVKEFYVILMCFLIKMCMSWLPLIMLLSMHGSTMKNNPYISHELILKYSQCYNVVFNSLILPSKFYSWLENSTSLSHSQSCVTSYRCVLLHKVFYSTKYNHTNLVSQSFIIHYNMFRLFSSIIIR